MKQIKEYVTDFPTQASIAEALLIAKNRKCQVNLRWFNPFQIDKIPVGDNVLEINEHMTYAKCLEKLGVLPIKGR